MDRKKEIQEQMNFDGQQDMSKIYEYVIEGLEKEIPESLDSGFARKVILRIEQIEKKKRFGYLLLMIGGLVFTLSGSIAMIFYIYGPETVKMFDGVINWAVLIGILVVTVQYLDSKLIHKRSMVFT